MVKRSPKALEFITISTIGVHDAVTRTPTGCSAQPISSTVSRIPAFHIRIVSLGRRPRVTRLLPWSRRRRRGAIVRCPACWARRELHLPCTVVKRTRLRHGHCHQKARIGTGPSLPVRRRPPCRPPPATSLSSPRASPAVSRPSPSPAKAPSLWWRDGRRCGPTCGRREDSRGEGWRHWGSL